MSTAIIVGIITGAVLALCFAGWYFYNVGVLRRRKTFLQNDPDLPQGTSGERGISKAWLKEQQLEKLSLKSIEGLRLNGYYLPSKEPISKTVILVHGYSSKAWDMAGFAQYYHEKHGMNILIPDSRGHGESEGNYIGFGWHDRIDLLKWINLIIERSPEEQIILHGVSMGGAAVLMTSGEELPHNVKCVISDCAYTSAMDILSFQLKRMYRLPTFPLIQITSICCKLRAGFYFKEASALKQVQKSRTPILFIHGGEDGFVPTEMVYSLYNAAVCEKELFLVEKAGHGEAYWQDTEGYRNKVEGFLIKHLVE